MNLLFCVQLNFIFIGLFVKKNIWRNLTVSQYFRPVVKMSPKPRKTFCYSNVTSHFRGLLIVIFRRIKWNEEYQVINCCFLSWLCTEIQYWDLYVYSTPQKLRFFILFDRWFCSMLLWKSKFDVKFLFPDNLSLKTQSISKINY